MDSRFEKYFLKKTRLDRWPLDPVGREDIVVAIPALAESKTLFTTLADLASNDVATVRRTLVLCVVNNRSLAHASKGDIEDNRRTLDRLRRDNFGDLRVLPLDASSPGRELGAKEGVGTARKIGLDWGARILLEQGKPNAPLVSLDADCRVGGDYLASIDRSFREARRWAAVVDYAHPLGDAEGEENLRGILAYETFLRYHELGLRHAGSPYAFATIGSTILCTPEAYVACGGMRERQAAEDFYFLQELAKTGWVDRLPQVTVHPSARPSHRVPFGTGRSMAAFLGGDRKIYRCHPPECFSILLQWLALVSERIEANPAEILAEADAISPPLVEFLRVQKFELAWSRIGKNHSSSENRLREFHRWFDAFRTLKLIHHLRDASLGRRPLFDSVETLLRTLGIELPFPFRDIPEQDVSKQKTMLSFLRDRMKESSRCAVW